MSRTGFAVLLFASLVVTGGCADVPVPVGGAIPAPPWLTLGDHDTLEDAGTGLSDAVPGEDAAPADVSAPDAPPDPDGVAPADHVGPPDASDCPVAAIVCTEGDEVIPQTVLHLDGTTSWSPFGAIAEYRWSVTQPPGSKSLLIPDDEWPEPKFEANVAGNYHFELEVWDTTGAVGCAPAAFDVAVIPDDGIHVELLWHTPADPDETDTGWGQGSDLDIHLSHPVTEGWFDPVYDCHHYNKTPEWGSSNPQVDDDPRLDRDDIDGAGPENINIHSPQQLSYRVGVHSWSEHGYGGSIAEIRVYLGSVLAFQWGGVEIGGNDMWDVCWIHYSKGEVEAIEGQSGAPQMSWIDPPPPP